MIPTPHSRALRSLLALGLILLTLVSLTAPALHSNPLETVALHQWDFEHPDTWLSPSLTLGGGTLTVTPGPDTEVVRNTSAQGFPSAHLRINNPLEAELLLALPSTGYEGLTLTYQTRRSGQGAGEQTIAWSSDGSTWNVLESYAVEDADPQPKTFDLSALEGVNHNAAFAVRVTFAQGAGGTAGNNRFDNISLTGTPLPDTNPPPVVVAPPGLQQLIAGGASADLDLTPVFEDDDPLTYTAESDYPAAVVVTVDGATLTLTGLKQGEALITVSADDGTNEPVSVTFRALVWPAPHALADGPFSFGAWDPDTPERVYPDHMLFLQSDVIETTPDTPLLYAYHLLVGDYHADDSETIGFPYNNTGRTRLNGLNSDGISFINTGGNSGRNRGLGGAVVALDTRNVQAMSINWLAGTLLRNERDYAIRLQYRTAIGDDFSDLLVNGQPLVYVASADNDTHLFAGIPLPADLHDQPLLQLLWRYHHVAGEAGPRSLLRLDDIRIGETWNIWLPLITR